MNPVSLQVVPPAIVLSNGLTGLATVRGLSFGRMDLHAATRETFDPATASRLCRSFMLRAGEASQRTECESLIDYCSALGGEPVVIPTSDADALWLARNERLLRPHCRFSSTSLTHLLDIVSKDRLYAIAQRLALPVVPSITAPSLDELDQWSLVNPAPYLLKPFYNRIVDSALRQKNLLVHSRESLLSYVAQNGSRALIVQRNIRGGDGYILDCYGLCRADGSPIALASHRRLRQGPADFGTTSFGEIPAISDDGTQAKLFKYTRALLGRLSYHGIFGIEWLQHRETGELSLIDFNARPFSSIGHLTDCGLNLPLLAYRDLTGEDLSAEAEEPVLKHLYWMDVPSDAYRSLGTGSIPKWVWLKSLLQCRSFAVWDWRDPGPWLQQTGLIVGRVLIRLRARFAGLAGRWRISSESH